MPTRSRSVRCAFSWSRQRSASRSRAGPTNPGRRPIDGLAAVAGAERRRGRRVAQPPGEVEQDRERPLVGRSCRAGAPVRRSSTATACSSRRRSTEGGKKSLLTLCFDRKTGKELWRHDFGFGVDQKTHAKSNLAVNTPAVTDRRGVRRVRQRRRRPLHPRRQAGLGPALPEDVRRPEDGVGLRGQPAGAGRQRAVPVEPPQGAVLPDRPGQEDGRDRAGRRTGPSAPPTRPRSWSSTTGRRTSWCRARTG